MRKSYFSIAFLCALLLAVGCQKQTGESSNSQENQTIAALVNSGIRTNAAPSSGSLQSRQGRNEFTLLAYALVRSGLLAQLDDPNAPFTLFAPTDAAFEQAGFGTRQSIDALPKATLQRVLAYHVLGAKVLAAQVPANTNTELTMLSGDKAYANRKPAGVFINGARVIDADIKARNGVIHVINRLLLPPAGNLVEVAAANPKLTYLVAAVVRASQGSTNVAAVLSSAGPYTVFAPTNQAFINAGFPTIAAINNAAPNSLAAILTYHVIAARVFSHDLSNGLQPTMLNNKTTTILLTNGPQVRGLANATPSNITATDIMATNGVVHLIDQVLLP